MINRDVALTSAISYIKQSMELIKQDAEYVGDDHNVGVCSCPQMNLWYRGLQWLHDYGDSTHTPRMVLEGLDEHDNLLYVTRCSECDKVLD